MHDLQMNKFARGDIDAVTKARQLSCEASYVNTVSDCVLIARQFSSRLPILPGRVRRVCTTRTRARMVMYGYGYRYEGTYAASARPLALCTLALCA